MWREKEKLVLKKGFLHLHNYKTKHFGEIGYKAFISKIPWSMDTVNDQNTVCDRKKWISPLCVSPK